MDTLNRELRAGCRVLDLGAGSGRNSLYLAGLGHDVMAVDVNPREVQASKAKALLYGDRRLRHQAVQGDMRRLDFPSESFDGVVSTHAFQDLDDEAMRVVQTMQDITTAGGVNLVIAYTGTITQRRVAPHLNLMPVGEVARAYLERGWNLIVNEQIDKPVTFVDGKPHFPSRCVVLARKPSPAVPRSAEEASLRDQLLKSDPEHYEDVFHLGLGA